MGVLEVHDVSIRYMTGDFKDIGLKEYVMRRLKKDYHVREFWADQNITFSLEKGDMLGIIGTNGAGKSTLLKVISGIMEPTGGYVKREGNVAALLELASGFDGDLTVRENAYLRGAMLGYTRRFMDETYDSIIDFAELKDFQDRPFKQLSSGMKSRLAFSIASLVQPDILILDEVLSVGDGAFRKKSEAKMREIIKSGATTILVSHSIQQVKALCNKVLWLEKGRQVAFGDDVQGICCAYEGYLSNQNRDSFSYWPTCIEEGKVIKSQIIDSRYTKDRKKARMRFALKVCVAGLMILSICCLGNYLNTSDQRRLEKQIAAVEGCNAVNPLVLESAYGDIEATHPKVISFDSPWNGYKYWMSFSPYPKADDSKENPHILASNDMENWREPEGFQNPLDDTPVNYIKSVVNNSDPELVYNYETDELECWWRFVDDSNGDERKVILYRRCSKNGLQWTEKEAMLVDDRGKRDYMSPAIIYEDGIYKMWSIAWTGFRIQYMESGDGKSWSEARFIDVEYPTPSIRSWHISVIHTEKGFEMTLVSFDTSLPEGIYQRGVMNLYYTSSKDNVSYERARVLLAPCNGEANWDNRGLYRSALLCDTDGKYYLFYSGISKDETRGVGKIEDDQFLRD